MGMGFRDDREQLLEHLGHLRAETDESRLARDRTKAELAEVRKEIARAARRATPWSVGAALVIIQASLAAVALLVLLSNARARDLAWNDVWFGHVRATSRTDVSAGAACAVYVSRDDDDDYARWMMVRCGHEVIYGERGSGLVHCLGRSDDPFVCRDDQTSAGDGDPTLDLDGHAGVLAINDGWRVEIELDDDGGGAR
jgi:hypothetical protein